MPIREERYPHGCDVDYLNEQVAEAMFAAHKDEHGAYPQKGCQWCEAEEQAEQEAQAEDAEWEAQRPVCQDCGEKGLPGFVAGDRCERLAKRNACVPETVCGGWLDPPESPAILVKCPQCGKLNVRGMYCTGCGWVPVRGEE